MKSEWSNDRCDAKIRNTCI